MRHVSKLLALMLLLLVAQHGAVVHDLSHLTGSSKTVKATGVLESTCAQCPAFAQASSAAFSHSFHLPLLVRTTIDPSTQFLYSVISAEALGPRSRGPPSKT
jgi:hypothetical protein